MEFKNLPIENEESRFKNHLNIDNNNRIILSGIFGIGKTYFINEFFKRNNNEYIEIRLNPVNYSVSANEDIFELIKFDIGLQLFKENPDFEKIDFGNYLATEYFFLNNYQSLIEKLITKLSKLDQNLNFVAKPILELRKKILAFRKSKKIDDENDLKTFLEEFTKKDGTIREENALTVLISFLLQTLKHTYPSKKTVLVIDDLDRIDPEHIFRILNIFSAHFDYY
ncbi:P-loop NTPase fold protein, partial [Salegentibacter sediminis]|uniref:P-loop NTPase fold protein n=1 Tax=Salegentibacter sediminis TaxID=1930251 RepID=UPI0021D27E2D